MNTHKKQPTKRRSIFVTSFSFFIISFLGWLYETLLVYLQSGEFCDRGFLRLPFCPIYGGVICLLYLLVGTPKEGRFADGVEAFAERKGWSSGVARVLRYVGYFLLSMLFATVGELIIGLIFENAGCTLWSYYGFACNYKGVICLPISLFWGFLITVVMRYPFQWLIRGLEKIPRIVLIVASVALGLALSVDFVFCLLQL